MRRPNVKIRANHLEMFFVGQDTFCNWESRILHHNCCTWLDALLSRQRACVLETPRHLDVLKKEVHILLLPASCTLQSYANT